MASAASFISCFNGSYNCFCHFNVSRAVGWRPFGCGCAKISGPGFGFGLQKTKKKAWFGRRRINLEVRAQLSSSLYVDIGLDSQSVRSRDSSHLPWVGPLPGDIAEVEAYCRIFRAAERFHNALMDALCNPLTGECSVSYDMPLEDKPLLEDKIVSVLGCMVCLLNKGREDVLFGRSSIINSFRDVDKGVMDDSLPPLANFRSEMKSYCESLHIALENYLTPGDSRGLNVWRKLQRLKNACYDVGFSREGDQPCQTLLANWGPIYLSTLKEERQQENLEVAFWKGSQVTEESLKWLLDNGFRTIVDLRAEIVKDSFYETVLEEAISSGKIELVKLPVEVGTIPSVEQVVQFAALVSDSGKKPIYVHSKEGRRRTSYMISRWRQYMDRITSSNQQVISTDVPVQDTRGVDDSEVSLSYEGGESSDDGTGSFPEKSGESFFPLEVLNSRDPRASENKIKRNKRGHDTPPNNQVTLIQTVNGETESSVNFYVSPLKSQLPPCDVFSKTEMSKFFRNCKVSPGTYFIYERKRLEMLSSLRYKYNGSFSKTEANSRTRLSEENTMNGSLRSVKSSLNQQIVPFNNGSYNDLSIFTSAPPPDGANRDGVHSLSKDHDSRTPRTELDKSLSSMVDTGERQVESYLSSDDDNLDMLEGNMCASATGVVRLQSRKKAEMFLVRTDGFSCTREKVTESSLAFTHPSTQQQMLLWKSTPKTVLLLKKLGQELMEEAKEAASFLYHQQKMIVLVEPEVHDVFARIPGFGFVQTFYSQDTSDLHDRVDLVACLGGDGVILHASNLFRGPVPPVVSFNLGSLGFLTSHTFDDFKNDLRQVIHGNNTTDGVYITLRLRLHCEIFRNGKAMPGKVFDVLNEVVIDRGSNPYLSKIECYEHDHLITKVQGDGVIVATPTGSTAYSTAAGGSMVHPNVPCMLFTPICPHSLSFRPVILPDSARLELKIPEDARSNAWVSFDGKRRQQLSRGDSVRISMSQHPLPTVNKSDQTGDWFRSLIRCLNWNERLDQKAL
ncbi:NAD kinase 2, chloroplastic-like isoform X1 [Primulina eburnea]|uniref:NAD kinase 2, chloroplastic-like isoform X1 n=2 Tax=Primulina eburnea TaxID=1245227 RepID=UPI003C6C8144